MRDLFTWALLFSTIRLATPLLLAALGGLFSERSGVINIALEGLMLAGAFTAAAVTYFVGNPWVGLLAGVAAGVLLASVHAVASIRFKADQVVSGTAINILMLGAPAFVSGALFASTGSTPQIPKENLVPWTPIVLAFVVLVPLTWYVLYRTPFGLRLRAVGENPEAADAAGINVKRLRYTAVLISGALAALGGAYLSIGQSSLFTRNMTSGRGFIALAALIFGKWRPVQTMLACLLFGFTEAVAIQLQGVKMPSGDEIPNQFIQIIPYLLTIIVLAGFIGHSRAPRALGIPYEKEK
ncbi:MAG: ral nucleoside transport system permease protein [Blastocatellia bacterium]|jgi:simple sugar transport system permease protein|nr:ral nucleoside transport system permease protein [Blastocatellia bacterium]